MSEERSRPESWDREALKRYRKVLEEIIKQNKQIEILFNNLPSEIPMPSAVSCAWYRIAELAEKALEEE